jgi:hypothetical protein
MMNPDERREYKGLGLGTAGLGVPVFQGCTAARDDGWSWTTDRDVAEWFAYRFADLEGSDPVVRATLVPKGHIFAYFTRRHEHEVLIDPRHVDAKHTTTTYLPKRRTK